MKKLITLLMMLFLVSFVVAQSSEDEDGVDNQGAPNFDFVKSQLGFLDKLRISQISLTVVNGALCSTNANYEKRGILTGSRTCWNNVNGGSPGGSGTQHIGVAYQVFRVTPKWGLVDEIFISGGTRGCVDIIPDKEYYRAAYYCDDTSKTCTKFVSECNNDIGAIRTRTCIPGGKETVQVTWQDSSVGSCDVILDIQPPPQNDVPSGSDGSGQTPTGTGLSGSYSDIRIPTNVRPGNNFNVGATFTADTTGRYYLESGIFEKQLAIVAVGSKCDGSKQFAGEFVDLQAGESVDMIFDIEAVTSTGTKSVVVGAYTACFKDGGSGITIEKGTINVLGAVNDGGIPGDINLIDIGIVGGLVIGGALVGSFAPGIGNLIGGVVGLAIGIAIIMI